MATAQNGKLALFESNEIKDKRFSFAERLDDEKIKDGVAIRKARKWFQVCLLVLLSFEVIFIAYLIVSQAMTHSLFTLQPFHLSSWDFAPFVNVALLQTCILIRPIAKNLFPSH